MEIVLLLVLIVLIASFHSSLKHRLEAIEEKLSNLERKITSPPSVKKEKPLQSSSEAYFDTQQGSVKTTETKTPSEPEQKEVPSPLPQSETKPSPEPEIVQADAVFFSKLETVKEEAATPLQPKEEKKTPEGPKVQAAYTSKRPPAKVPHEETWYERFRKNNPDLERYIGQNILSMVAITVLVIGIGFFVKYAIDKNWINEVARVGIGILCSGIVLGFAHRLRLRFEKFSSVLVAGASAIFYFTVGIGFHQYHLFNQVAAFCLMLVITVFTVFISIAYDRKELAILALLGGFATPAMVSTGAGNYRVLFSYIAILDVGMILLAFYRRWNIIKIMSYVLTLLLFVYWVEGKVIDYPGGDYAAAFFFATLFYVLFLAMNLVNSLRQKIAFDKVEIAILVSNTLFYFGMGFQLMHFWHPVFEGLFCMLMALFNLGLTVFLYRREAVDNKLIYTFIGFTLSFGTIAGPVQLEGNFTTLFFAMEAVLLLWLAQRSGMLVYRFANIGVLLMMGVSLAMDWFTSYHLGEGYALLFPLANKVCMTGLVCVAALFGMARLLRNELIAVGKDDLVVEYLGMEISTKFLRAVLNLGFGIMLYFVLAIELSYQLNRHITLPSERHAVTLWFITFHLLFLVMMQALLHYKQLKEQYKWVRVVLLISLIYFYVIGITVPISDYRLQVFAGNRPSMSLVTHYISFLAAAVLTAVLVRAYKVNVIAQPAWRSNVTFALQALLVYVCSLELLLHIFWLRVAPVPADSTLLVYDSFKIVQRHVIKVGFPILWGILSLLFLLRGMRRNNRHLRIGALVLIAIILVKLFTYDISNASEAGKIIAFIILGIVLLLISFLYQKIKALVVEEKPKEKDAE